MSDYVDPNLAQLRDYIDQSLAAGQSREQIKVALMAAGWNEEQVGNAFGEQVVSVLPPVQSTKQRSGLRGVVVGALLLLGLGAGGVYGVNYLVNQSNWPLDRAVTKLRDIDSMEYEFSLKSVGEKVGFGDYDGFELYGTGVLGWGNSSVASRSQLDSIVTVKGEEVEENFGTETFNEYLYVEPNGMLEDAVGKVNSDWVRLDRDSGLKKEKVEMAGDFEADERRLLFEAYERHPLVVVDKNLGIELEGAESVVRFSLKSKGENLGALLDEWVRIDERMETTKERLGNLNKDWKVTGEVAVGLLDGKIHQLSLNLVGVGSAYTGVEYRLDIRFSNHGAEFEIREPESFSEYDKLAAGSKVSKERMGKELEGGGDGGGELAETIGDQFGAARDSQRRADLYAITNAIYLYAAEHNGDLPETMNMERKMIGTGEGKIDLGAVLAPAYLAEMPKDPKEGSVEASGYYLYVDKNGRVVVEARSEVSGEVIRITR